MDIIKLLDKLKTNLLETKLFEFETYKTIGIHISQLSTNDQIKCISFIFQNLFDTENNNNFTFYLFILQSYIHNLKEIDSYKTSTISKVLLTSVTKVRLNQINILNLLETLYSLDYSVLLKDTKVTILTYYIYKYFYEDNTNDANKNYFSIMMYILKKGNYYNSKDPINVYRHLYYLSKYQLEIKSIINFKELMEDERHVLNIITIVKECNKGDNILEKIHNYCNSNNLDVEKILNSTDKSNNHLLTFCNNYETFEALYKSKLIYNTNLYQDESLEFRSGVNILKPMYYIILSRLKEDEDIIKFMSNHLGIVEVDYKKNSIETHNETIKQIIKTNCNVLYDKIWAYIV